MQPDLNQPRLLFPVLVGALLAAAWAALPSSLRAETTSNSGATAITSLPYTISTAGTYYLSQQLSLSSASQTAIAISTSGGVTIDLNGHTITNTYGAATTASCIKGAEWANVTVRNGTIVGFQYGVQLTTAGTSFDATCASYGHLIENVTFLKNTYCAAKLTGVGCRIFRCRAVLTGGASPAVSPENFKINGAGNSVEECSISGKAGTSTAYGVTVSQGPNNFVANNRFSAVEVPIHLNGGDCKYRDNLTAGATNNTVADGGTDAGDNN